MPERKKNSNGEEKRNVLFPKRGDVVIENLMLCDPVLTPQIERIRESFPRVILPKRVLLDDTKKR